MIRDLDKDDQLEQFKRAVWELMRKTRNPAKRRQLQHELERLNAKGWKGAETEDTR